MDLIHNILIFPGGSEIGLEILKSLSPIKGINLFSASSNVSNHAPFVFKKHNVIADIYSKNCIKELNKIIKDENIHFIFPANDLIIDFLIDNEKQIDCKMILPDKSIVRLVRSKRDTYKYFKDIIPCPKVFSKIEDILNYPVFVKPNMGYGAQGARIIQNNFELKECIKNVKDPLIQEYLPGDEYTIDCFSSRVDGLIFSAARKRARIRMGTSMNGLLVKHELDIFFKNYARIISDKLGISGAWFFQMKMDEKGNYKLLEIEPRIAGTMALNRVRGINFPLLSIYEILDIKYKININNYDIEIDRSLENRYKLNIEYNSVYVDLDDTILIKGSINIKLIQFLYQCINNGIEIILLTKSLSKNLNRELKKYRIEQIFDEVIWIKESDSKSKYIDACKKPIFIDDSFSQRLEVEKKCKILTFDCSMIESLIDERF